MTNQTAFVWIIFLSYSPSTTSWIPLATAKKRDICTTPMAPKGLLKHSCTFSRSRRNSNQSKLFLYSRPTTSGSSSRFSKTPANCLCSFWLRFARDATQGQRRRFIDTFQAYVHGLQEQVINCIHQTCPSIERYVKLRRNISAIWVCGSSNMEQELPLN